MVEIFEIIPKMLSLFAVTAASLKVYSDHRARKKADDQVTEAEKQAYQAIPESLVKKTQELSESQVNLEQQARDVASLIENSRNALQMGSLFNLYSKQIEKYQTQTQGRASWSFIFAIVAMAAGLGLVGWGGTYIVSNADWPHVAVGSLISILGGTISAFIAKTFLDVHRLSLVQLNHYFRQPVLNSHILTAQRLADQLTDQAARQKAYEAIIEKVSDLISLEPVHATDIYGKLVEVKPVTKTTARKKTQEKMPGI